VWLGITGGLFICVMGFTGGVVGLRPQIASLISPAVPDVQVCQASPDWNAAGRDIAVYAHSQINRIYGPDESDSRYRFRMVTDQRAIYQHVIYDACSGRILGTANLAWMDWTVDLHHNLLAGKTGRIWAGFFGLAMLVSGVTGLILWLLTKPSLRTAFQVKLRWSRATPRQLHRAVGVFAMLFLMLEAFTGLWLCFPQTMGGMLSAVAPTPEDVRPARAPRGEAAAEHAGLGDLMAAALAAIPDGRIREIRLPDGNGSAQVRMWRPGDFRSTGNNVVYVSTANAQVLGLDRYAERSASNRFTQAMTGLHFDEWGGLPLRVLCAVAGLLTPVLFVSGLFLWWYTRPRRTARAAVEKVEQTAVAV
jgi:uncharacterized iron-regulated membrane protein